MRKDLVSVMPSDTTYYDEDTVHKAYEVLLDYVSDKDALNILTELRNRGIVLREIPTEK